MAELIVFRTLLPIVARKEQGWHVQGPHCIRDKNGRCPLCALVHEIDPRIKNHWNVQDALRQLGVKMTDADDVRAIMNAADNPYHLLRAPLMRILGMEVPQ